MCHGKDRAKGSGHGPRGEGTLTRPSGVFPCVGTCQHPLGPTAAGQVLKFFSYEHFYVIYCKFWELDQDHDFLLDKNDLAHYSNCALSYVIVDRIFEEVRGGGLARAWRHARQAHGSCGRHEAPGTAVSMRWLAQICAATVCKTWSLYGPRRAVAL